MRRVYLAGSLGGHLDVLETCWPAVQDIARTWVTVDGVRAAELRARGERVLTLPRMDRRNLSLRNPARSIRFALGERPELVVTAGAGVVLPFCLAARARGARIVLVETLASVDAPSFTGRVLGRLADAVMVHWPELAAYHRGAVVCRPALPLAATRGAAGEGTFVAVGSHDRPFDRLLAMVDDAAGAGLLPAPVVAQTGVSRYRPRHFSVAAWLTPDEYRERLRKARLVVSHAGGGVVAAALRVGRRPIVVARAGAEHVNDHQLQITRKLSRLGLVVEARDEITRAHVESAGAPLPAHDPLHEGPSLAEALGPVLAA